MKIAIREGDLHLHNLRTRIPFRYGIATMTHMPMIFLRLRVELNGATGFGIAADILPPKWFTKQKDKSLDEEVFEMLRVIEQARALALGLEAPTVFRLWKELYEAQLRWGAAEGLAPLLANFGTSLVERALIDGVCRLRDTSFNCLLHENLFDIQPGEIHDSLRHVSLGQLLPTAPLPTLTIRHTIGLGDPLTDEGILVAERLHDGLPQSLEACIQRYRLRHFKVKVQNRLEIDRERLCRIAAVIEAHAPGDYAFSLDGNEQFESLEEFRHFWECLQQHGDLRRFLEHLLFVEQPVHRQSALSSPVGSAFTQWRAAPPIIIDESDATLESLPRALELGYAGASHKNCKGVFKGMINHCLLRHRNHQQPGLPSIMSGEDLCNIGPVALLQDLAVNALLGIRSVERNGHHYNAGLSGFPESVQAQILRFHPDLYEPSAAGWPTLRIHDGQIQLDSVNQAPFGVGFLLDVDPFIPYTLWTWDARAEMPAKTKPGDSVPLRRTAPSTAPDHLKEIMPFGHVMPLIKAQA